MILIHNWGYLGISSLSFGADAINEGDCTCAEQCISCDTSKGTASFAKNYKKNQKMSLL